MTTPDNTSQEPLRETFNRWAEEGRGEGMEEHHLPIVEPMLALMDIEPADCILDVGCGTGWLVRRLAVLVPEGQVVGVDVSNEMIRRARLANARTPNVKLLCGGVDKIPAENDSFTKVLSVESAYYWPDPAQGLREIHRVLRPGGSAWILINYYRDNPHCHQWGPLFGIPSHLLSAAEWQERLSEAGFHTVSHRRVLDPTPTPKAYSGPWFRDADQMRRFKAEGALLATGTKAL